VLLLLLAAVPTSAPARSCLAARQSVPSLFLLRTAQFRNHQLTAGRLVHFSSCSETTAAHSLVPLSS